VGEEAREAHVPRLEVAPRALRSLARAVRARVAGHEHDALRAEALESLARPARARHDCFVVTELAAVSPLEDFSLLEDDEPLDSLEPDDSALGDPEPDPLEVLVVFAALLAAADRTLRLAEAVSAGSCPDASCT
jgi:hypothetical protein